MQRKLGAVEEDGPPRSPPWIFWSAASLSVLAVQETLADARDPAIHAFGWWLAALAIGLGLRAVSRTVFPLDSTPALTALLALGLVAPLCAAAWNVRLGAPAPPRELQLLSSLRNAVLVLSFAPKGRRLQPLVAATTVFVAVVAAAQGSHPLLLPTLAAWGASTAAWMAATLTTARGETPPFPFGAVTLVAAAFALLSGWHATSPSAGGTVLAEWLQSSGGTSTHSSGARGGVGDGEASIDDGENPESDGGDGKKFVESHERSFYDAFTEVYGEPAKPKDVQRAVPLPMERLAGHQRTKSHQASRKFSLHRKPPKRKFPRKDRAATALLYVTGPTPIHVRLQTFAFFDGEAWHEVEELEARPELRVERERWLQLASALDRASSEPVAHTIKIGAYSDRMVPLPTLTREFRIGLVNRGDFFEQPSAEVVRLSESHARIVGGESIETISDTLDERRIAAEIEASGSADPAYGLLPDDPNLRATLAATVRKWTGDARDRWRNVQAVVGRLRADFVHEPAGTGAKPATWDVAEFLTQRRSGPDYMFATAAALLLRELGCSTRLAVGYYAGPEHFDAWSRSTPVQASQLHAWAEVFVLGRWIPVEATPGYRTLGPRWSWSGRIRTWVLAVSEAVHRRPAAAAAAALSVVATIGLRKRLVDGAFTLACLVALRRRREESFQWTRRLLDLRLRLAGRPRPASRSLRRWLAEERRTDGASGASLREFLDRFDEAVYGRNRSNVDAADVAICRAVVRFWTTARLRGEPRRAGPWRLGGALRRKPAAPHPEALANV